MSSIQPKHNTCSVEGCNRPSGTWTKCTHHRAIIYAERSKKKREAMGISSEDDQKFYRDIWKHDLHFCAECGSTIKEFNWDNFHHILPKNKYPALRYEKYNIIILCGKYGCHAKAESAISYPKMKIYAYCESVKKQFLKDQYQEHKTQNHGNYKTAQR